MTEPVNKERSAERVDSLPPHTVSLPVMPTTQVLVSPTLPTTLANDACVELPGYDIWPFDAVCVFVIPTKLDVSKFEDALSRALQLYPHASGRLRCSDGSWFIELTNTAVPVDIVQEFDTSFDSLLDGDWVAQFDLSQLLSRAPMVADLVNGDVPLVCFKLTFFRHETCICISWNHSLGDGVVISRFMHTISQFYQGLPHEYAAPTFKKHRFPEPSPSAVTDLSPALPSVLTGKFDEAAYINSLKDLGHVRWQFDTRDLEVLRSALYPDKQNRNFLSKQDCLIAYIVSVLNHNRINPMQKVANTSSYRHTGASFVEENAASNLLVVISANVPFDMVGIATAVRDARIQAREPYYIYTQGMLVNKIMLDSANAGRPPPFQTGDNELIFNSHTGLDWCSAHFGHPAGTRFFLPGLNKHYLRIFRSNPTRGEDGVWQASRSIEISVGVPEEMRQGIMETFARGVQYMLNLNLNLNSQHARL